jgi:hypothetical protein
MIFNVIIITIILVIGDYNLTNNYILLYFKQNIDIITTITITFCLVQY